MIKQRYNHVETESQLGVAIFVNPCPLRYVRKRRKENNEVRTDL